MQRLLAGSVPGVLLLAGIGVLSSPASAQSWTDWTAMTFGSMGSATGVISLPGGDVTVTYSGEVLGGSQTSCGTAWLANTWPAHDGTAIGSSPVPTYNPPPECEMIQVSSPGTYFFSFSSPVLNPWMTFVSVGQSGVPVTYDFDNAPFAIVDEGRGHWGDGSLTELAGDILEGREGHGVIRFQGTYSTLRFTTNPAEFWHGFNVGASTPTNGVVPEPMSMILLGTGLAGVVLARRRRKR